MGILHSKSRIKILLLGATGTGKSEFLNNLCEDGPGLYGGRTHGIARGNHIHGRTQLELHEIGGNVKFEMWEKLLTKGMCDCIYFFVNLEWSRLKLLEQKNLLVFAILKHPNTPVCIIGRWRKENVKQLCYEEVVDLLQLKELGDVQQSIWYVQMTHYGKLALQGVELLLDWTVRTCQIQQLKKQSASPENVREL